MSGAGGRASAGSGAVAGTGMMSAGAGGGSSGAGDAYQPCPATGDCKILPLGDSITFGLGYAGSYRVEMFHRAHMANLHITFTGSLMNGPSMVDGVPFPQKNEGHSGWKIDQLLPLLPSPALTDMPHIILLMIGTNDVAQNDDLPNAPKRLGALIDKLIMLAPDALIVVGNLTPLGFGSGGVDTYNAAVPDQVNSRAAMGKHVKFVDLHAVVTTAELADGVHPNQEGSNNMAGVFYSAISSLLH